MDVDYIDASYTKLLHVSPDRNGFLRDRIEQQKYIWKGIASTGIVPKIARKLNEAKAERATTLCFGSHGRFFLQLNYGECCWEGPPILSELQKCGEVKMVAFGGRRQEIAVAYTEDTVQGLLPHNLEHIRHVPVHFLSFGPDGSWFVRFTNASFIFNVRQQWMKKELDKLGQYICEVMLGGSSFIARHN